MPSFNNERVPREALQLINDHGVMDVAGLDSLVRATGLSECGVSYCVVAAMGPQSSGKSTLLNKLFNTPFQELDASVGRHKTNEGVWLAHAKGVDSTVIVMDLEGTDGRERGEDTAFCPIRFSYIRYFDYQYVCPLPRWEKDVGLEQSANRPLLGTIFQVLLRLPGDHKCRTTLLFVIRDTTNTTSFRDMERYLRNDVQEIWKNTPKPPAHEKTELKQFFTVEVATLPHFYLQQELFQEEVSKLRARFNNPFQPGGLAAHRQGVVPGSAFSTSIIEIWRSIKENNYLNLPAHKVMLAKWRCPEIVQEQLSALLEDPVWKLLDESAKKGPVPGFAKTWNDLLQKYLLKYDDEAGYFDAGVKEDKRADLRARALAIVQPAYQAAISNLRNGTLNKFKSDTKDLAERPAGGRPPSSFLSAVKQCAEQALADFDQGSSGTSRGIWRMDQEIVPILIVTNYVKFEQ